MELHGAVRTVSKNLVVNIFWAFWQFVLLIVGTRIALDRLGADSFGILALVGGTVGYFLYLDIGMGETVVKKVSEEQNPEKLSALVSTLFFFSAGIGAVLSVCTLLFGLYGVDALFSFAPPLMRSVSRVFLVIAGGVWLLYPLNVFGKVFAGLNRLDVYNALRIVFQTAILGGIIVALEISSSAESAVLAITIIGVVWKATAWLVLRRMYPEIKIRPSLFDRKLLAEMFRYGAYASAGQAGGHVVYQCDIYVIGAMLNPAVVTVYSVANLIAVKIAEVAGAIIAALFPMASSFYGRKMHEPLRKSFMLSTQLMAIAILPVTVFIFAYSAEILEIWVGAEYSSAAPALKWLSVAWTLNAIAIVCAVTLKAVNRPDIEARRVIVVAVANLALDIFFVKWFGFMGAVYATFFIQIIWLLLIMSAAAKNVGVDFFSLLFGVMKIIALGCLLGAVYLVPLPLGLFFVPLIVHASVFYLLCYFFVLDREYKSYVQNIAYILLKK